MTPRPASLDETDAKLGRADQLATLVWSFLVILEKLRGVGGGGTSLRICQLLDRRFETSPIHILNV
ncbi:MAG: hypothetical protein AB7T38_05895, partial [Nitrospirales bacterium]